MTQERIALGLVFHQHQPIGNFDFVFEEMLEKAYEPLLACLERHPAIRASLHYSGPLIDWLDEHHPAYLERVAALAASGQAELMGGGYYEPILPSIIEEDRIGQLAMMRDELERRFGAAPAGAWIAERVWEPALPSSLEAAGYRWAVVDDVHFEATGLPREDVAGWYLTESEGHATGVFGGSTEMRYLVPFKEVADSIEYLRGRARRTPGGLVVMADDGEKFGGWPTTFEHCWRDGWVDRWLEALEQESDWLETVRLSDWMARTPSRGLIYLPTMSYMEMGKWALPPGAQAQMDRGREVLEAAGAGDALWLLRGGAWSNFLVRYPEANLLQKRAMELSRQAREAHNGDALAHIWKAQCNCPYWHGVFGGVYLEHIRHANFGHLAKADALVWAGQQPPEVRDWDFDGQDEAGLRSERHFALVSSSSGEIVQWELREPGWNLTHVVALRPEAYHAHLANRWHHPGHEIHSIHDEIEIKDPEVGRYRLQYDRRMRLAAQDTALRPHAGREQYERARGSQSIEVEQWSVGDQTATTSLVIGGLAATKTIAVGDELQVDYEAEESLRLFSEWNLSLPVGAPNIEQRAGLLRVAAGPLVLEAEHGADDVWWEQVRSVSNTEAGLELAPQGWCFVFSGQIGPNRPALTIRWRALWAERAESGAGA